MLDDGSKTLASDQIASHLTQLWAAQFQSKHVSKSRLQQFLRSNVVSLDVVQPPTCNTLKSVLRKHSRGHSAPGPDGIPYRLWAATPNESCCTLVGVLQDLSLGGRPLDCLMTA